MEKSKRSPKLAHETETEEPESTGLLRRHLAQAARELEETLQFLSGALRWASIAQTKLDVDDKTTRDGMKVMQEEATTLFSEINKTLNKIAIKRQSKYEQKDSTETPDHCIDSNDLGLLCDSLDHIGARYHLIDHRYIELILDRDGDEACKSVPEYALAYGLDQQMADRIKTMVEIDEDLAYFFDSTGKFLGQAIFERQPFTPAEK